MPENERPIPPAAEQTAPQPERSAAQLVTVESQREFDLFSGRRSERTFLKLYVEARSSGLLAAISDRDWKTLCTLATYMDAEGYCFPSQVELARALGCSRQMANARIQSLSRFRFQGNPVVLVEKDGRSEQGTWSRNGYRILPIASLGIFDDSPTTPSDRRKLTRPTWAPASPTGDDETVSRDVDREGTMSTSLDTAETDAAVGTVSSATVPVQLDTNKNQRINKNQINISNIRKTSVTQQDGAGTLDLASRDPNHDTTLDVGAILASRQPPTRPPVVIDSARDTIQEYLADFRREFPDRASLKSSTTRAYHLYQASGVTLDTFIDALYRARAIVKERTGSIRGAGVDEQGRSMKNKMAYFFAVLEDVLGLRPTPAEPAP